MLKNLIKETDFADRTEITLPYYFKDSEEPLVLTLRLFDGQVYASDNGRAYSELKKKSEDIALKMAEYFACVYLELTLGEDKEISVPVDRGRDLFKLIQVISLIANAHKYPEIKEYYMEFHLPYCQRADKLSDTSAPKEFVKRLFDEIQVKGRDGKYCIKLPFFFKDEVCPMGIMFSKNDMTLTDFGDFDGGRLIDRVDWLNGGELPDDKIAALSESFGCTYDGTHIWYKLQKEKDLSRAIFDFLQAASVIGEIGHYIV